MQGILKSNHERLCECLQDVKNIEPAGSKLLELEEHLKSLFSSYQEKMRELKRLVLAYEEKQKTIKNEIKRIKKSSSSLQDSKKTNSFAMSKAVVLILLPMQRVLIGMVSETDFSSFFHL
jgi:predicted nuclease with TOPRIM domain